MITCLLKVDPKDRFSEDQAFGHAWLRDPSVFQDCRALEERLGGDNFLTRFWQSS